MEQNQTPGISQSPVLKNSKQTGGVGLKITTAIAIVVAVCGIGFGVYGILGSEQKSQQIADIETELANKNQKITELEDEISQLDSESEDILEPTIDEPESEVIADEKTATIALESTLDENETRTVFEIGECTADGPSVKCPVSVNGKDALISYNSNDSLLRLTIPNE